MSLKDLDIKLSYISCGDDNIAKAFLVPALKQAKRYRRSVGFFSSGVFGPIIDGIVALSRSGGTIELIASPKLNAEDVEAINLGYQRREQIIENAFTRDFLSEIEALDDAKLQLLATLIANGILDIRIAVTETVGIYHDKLGIIEDFDGNVVVFYGSANESLGGYKNNRYKQQGRKRSLDTAETSTIQSMFEKANHISETYHRMRQPKRVAQQLVQHYSRQQRQQYIQRMQIHSLIQLISSSFSSGICTAILKKRSSSPSKFEASRIKIPFSTARKVFSSEALPFFRRTSI